MRGKGYWTLQMPRSKCPHCGGTIRAQFRGRFRVLKVREKAKREGLDREGVATPCEGDASDVPDQEIPLQEMPEDGD